MTLRGTTKYKMSRLDFIKYTLEKSHILFYFLIFFQIKFNFSLYDLKIHLIIHNPTNFE